MNGLPWFPECLSLPETGTMVVHHIFVLVFDISMLFLCLNRENRNYPHLDCGVTI